MTSGSSFLFSAKWTGQDHLLTESLQADISFFWGRISYHGAAKNNQPSRVQALKRSSKPFLMLLPHLFCYQTWAAATGQFQQAGPKLSQSLYACSSCSTNLHDEFKRLYCNNCVILTAQEHSTGRRYSRNRLLITVNSRPMLCIITVFLSLPSISFFFFFLLFFFSSSSSSSCALLTFQSLHEYRNLDYLTINVIHCYL